METIAGIITSAGLLLMLLSEYGVITVVPVIKPSSRDSAINQHIGQDVNQQVGQSINQHVGEPVDHHVETTNCKEVLWRTLKCHVPALDGNIELTNSTGKIDRLYVYCDAKKHLPSRLLEGFFESLGHTLKYISINDCNFINISRNAFKGLKQLQRLLIKGGSISQKSRNGIETLNGSSSTELTITEHASPPATTACNHDNLVLPDGIFSELDKLYDLELISMRLNNSVWQVVKILISLKDLTLSRNNITIIDINAINKLQKLKWLALSDNYIQVIQNGSFESLSLLWDLYLSSNRIRLIEREAFKGLSNLDTLYLSDNYIQVIQNGSFESLSRLRYLYLSSNRIRLIEREAFKGLSNLDTLYLSDNYIQVIQNGTFESLSLLRYLGLSSSRIRLIEREAFKGLSNLTQLYLSDNYIQVIQNRTFESLSLLQYLYLSSNRIRLIEREAFKGLSNLTQLYLSDNYIQVIQNRTFESLSLLQYLYLSSNRIRLIEREAFKGLTRLKTLDLSGNSIHTLEMDTFKGLTWLHRLDLSRNSISTVETDTFAGLRNIRRLLLTENHIKTIAVETLSQLTTLQELDLSDNLIYLLPTFPSSLEVLNLRNNNIIEVDTSSFAGLTGVITLDLSHNTINEFAHHNIPNTIQKLNISSNNISVASFHLPSHLSYADLRNNQIKSLGVYGLKNYRAGYGSDKIYISGNGGPFRCVCNSEVSNNGSSFNYNGSNVTQYHIWDFVSVNCSSKNTHESREITKISLPEFSCQYKTSCPDNCTCYLWKYRENINIVDCLNAGLMSFPANISASCTILDLSGNMFQSLRPENFEGLSQILELYLNSSNITEIEEGTFQGLSHLTKLDLGNNNISQLDSEQFKGLSRLSFLDLSFNGIHVIMESTFESLKSLKYLDLARNKLEAISTSAIESMYKLKSLYLSNNPWSCNCTFLENFIPLTMANGVLDQGDIICFMPNKTKYQLIKISLSKFCPVSDTDKKQSKQMTKLEIALIASFSLFFAVTILFCILLKNKDFLKLLCFIKFGWRPGKNEMDRFYDAFVSYSSEDTAFIVNEVMPRLEEPGQNRPAYKLCVHFRDFPVGACIANTILASIRRSRRVIIILSDNFLSSEWCHYEFQAAHYQLITEKRNRIIMVLLHDINTDLLDEKLKMFLQTRTYVKYGDPRFWNKIEYVMPKQKKEGEGNLNVDNIDDQINDIPVENIQDDVQLLNPLGEY